jgi:5-hydroxyisourate hydrolase-like protein (transthyretin family)
MRRLTLRLLAASLVLLVTAPLGAAGPQTEPERVVRFVLESAPFQSTPINMPFPDPVIVRAVDGDSGGPLAAIEVQFRSTGDQAGAVLPSPTAITDSDGRVTMPMSADGFTGYHYLGFDVAGYVALEDSSVTLYNLPSAPATVTTVSGNNTELPLGGGHRQLKVRVTNAAGVRLEGVAVSFVGPTIGAGLGPLFQDEFQNEFQLLSWPMPGGGLAITNYDGVATLDVFANGEGGGYSVEARVEGVAAAAHFSLANVVRTIVAIFPNGSPQNEYDGEDAPVGGRFDAIRFKAVDADGFGVAGVTLTLTAPATGASLALDQSMIVTDGSGFAETAGTANQLAGSYYLRADAAELDDPVDMLMQNQPPGFRIGDALADVPAADHVGVMRSLRGFLSGSNYLIIDVCTAWCAPCQGAQPESQVAKSELAAMGIPLTFVPLLVDGLDAGQPSVQFDALRWRNRFLISDPVLHVSGDAGSAIASAAAFILGASRPGYPTYLLVAPDGTIVARHTGAMSADGVVAFVLENATGEFSVAPATVNEAGGLATVTVTRSLPGGASSVDYATSAGSAVSADFSSRSGTLQFAPGQTSAAFTVPVTNDVVDEPNEQFTVTLATAVGASLGQATAAITIVDNDAPSSLILDDARITEGTGSVTTLKIFARLDRPSAFSVAVAYAALAGTATAKDVTLSTGKLTFAPGQTQQVLSFAILADNLIESKETFTVRLSDAQNATLVRTDATMTIVDDDWDTAPPVIAAKADVVIEVKMSPASAVAVNYLPPAAKDDQDGAVLPVCQAPSGAKHFYGTSVVTCVAEDRAGNLATRAFNIVVRLPTVAGAIFDPANTTTPLAQIARAGRMLIHVNAGAFAPRAKVALTFLDAAGRLHVLHQGRANDDGGLDEMATIPGSTAIGLGEVHADSGDAAEYDRAWFVTVTEQRPE